ncbi:MAG: Ig-like domain-containing protein [Pseudomonadota bacterium]
MKKINLLLTRSLMLVLVLLLASTAFVGGNAGCGSAQTTTPAPVDGSTPNPDPVSDPDPSPVPVPAPEPDPDPTPAPEGDTTVPEATVTPANQTTVIRTQSIVIFFNESMDTASLALAGTMADDSDGGVWSTTTNDNDTLTISPVANWNIETGNLVIEASDLAGNALATLTVTFGVQVVYVKVGGIGDGTMANPFASIREAITLAQTNLIVSGGTWNAAEVHVAEGTYEVDHSTDTHIIMVDGVSLFGGYSPTNWTVRNIVDHPTVIADIGVVGGVGGDPSCAVENGSGISADTIIDGFSIIGGGAGEISAIFNHDDASPTISNNMIGLDDSEAPETTNGIYNRDDSSPIIENNTIDGGNSTTTSNGIMGSNRSSLIIRNNNISAGDATMGVGVYNIGSSNATIQNNVISGGVSTIFTMAIAAVGGGAFVIENNIIFGGTALITAGLLVGDNTALIRNNIIDAGQGTTDSYGIRIDDSQPIIENNLIFSSGTGDEYCIYEITVDSDPTAVNNNNLFSCSTALYHDADGDGDILAVGDMELDLTLELITAANNISEDVSGCLDSGASYIFDSSLAGCGFTLDDFTFDTAGADGAAAGWDFIDDLLGLTRTGDGTSGWSIGAHEYD